MEILTNGNTFGVAFEYFKRKTLQLNIEGFRLVDLKEYSNIGVVSSYLKNNQEYTIFYLYRHLRGKGIYERVVKSNKWSIIVSDPIYFKYFKDKGINYLPFLGIFKSAEYLMACDYYGGEVDLDNIPLIYKLDLRIYVLRSMGGNYNSIISMCMDDVLKLPLSSYGSNDLVRTLKEYRTVRNSNNDSDMSSVSLDVKKMIVASEVQKKIVEDMVNPNLPRESRTNLYKKIKGLGFNVNIYNYYKKKIELLP